MLANQSFSEAVGQRSGLSAKRSNSVAVVQQSGRTYQQINLYNYGRINSNSYPCLLGNVPCAFLDHQHHAETKRAQEAQGDPSKSINAVSKAGTSR